jgi:hypothetical protein
MDDGEHDKDQFPRSSPSLENYTEIRLVNASPHKMRNRKSRGKAIFSIRAVCAGSNIRITLGLRLFALGQTLAARRKRVLNILAAYFQKCFQKTMKGCGGVSRWFGSRCDRHSSLVVT